MVSSPTLYEIDNGRPGNFFPYSLGDPIIDILSAKIYHGTNEAFGDIVVKLQPWSIWKVVQMFNEFDNGLDIIKSDHPKSNIALPIAASHKMFPNGEGSQVAIAYPYLGKNFTYWTTKTKMDLQTKLRISYEMLIGLHNIHMHGKVFEDVKPDNIVFDKELGTHLVDLAVAHTINNEPTAYGNCLFSSPEIAQIVLNGEPQLTSYASDMWGAAAVMYYILSDGQKLYNLSKIDGNDERQIWQAAASYKFQNFSRKKIEHAGPEIVDLILGAIFEQPENRPRDEDAISIVLKQL